MNTDMNMSLRDRAYPTMLKEGGERGGRVFKRHQVHSTFVITKEMLNGC